MRMPVAIPECELSGIIRRITYIIIRSADVLYVRIKAQHLADSVTVQAAFDDHTIRCSLVA